MTHDTPLPAPSITLHGRTVIYNHITLKVDGSEDAPDGPHFLINAFGLRFA